MIVKTHRRAILVLALGLLSLLGVHAEQLDDYDGNTPATILPPHSPSPQQPPSPSKKCRCPYPNDCDDLERKRAPRDYFKPRVSFRNYRSGQRALRGYYDDDGVYVLPPNHPSCKHVYFACPWDTPEFQWECPIRPTRPPPRFRPQRENYSGKNSGSSGSSHKKGGSYGGKNGSRRERDLSERHLRGRRRTKWYTIVLPSDHPCCARSEDLVVSSRAYGGVNKYWAHSHNGWRGGMSKWKGSKKKKGRPYYNSGRGKGKSWYSGPYYGNRKGAYHSYGKGTHRKGWRYYGKGNGRGYWKGKGRFYHQGHHRGKGRRYNGSKEWFYHHHRRRGKGRRPSPTIDIIVRPIPEPTTLAPAPMPSPEPTGTTAKNYTLDADFDEGTLINVNHDSPNNDQLQLDSESSSFNYIWVAASGRGTVVKIDTTTGTILGEFKTTPSSQGWGDPSRTTVDSERSVWVANRNNVYDGFGSVVHIGLKENGQCEDRNNNGIIDTSTGLGDIKTWTNPGVETADDECIVSYTKVNSRGTRHVSINANNDVWVGGSNLQNFDLVKGGKYTIPDSGTIIQSETSVGFGGYGGLMDENGVIWSTNPMLRWDTTAGGLTGPDGDPAGPDIGPLAAGSSWGGDGSFDSYGTCIDSQGNVWVTAPSGNEIRKFDSNGVLLGTFEHGNSNAQGCVVSDNDEVFVAHSLIFGVTTVGHIANDGTPIGNIDVFSNGANCNGPTGVALDGSGKIWAACINTNNVVRIDPTLNGGVGGVDLTVSLGDGAEPYNYSDMTGSTLIQPPDTGTWSVVYDTKNDDQVWDSCEVIWSSDEPGDSTLAVTVASGTDGSTFGPAVAQANNSAPTVGPGRYLRIDVSFQRSTSTSESPVLFDLSIDCPLA